MRTGHRKARTGCQRCKERKVKCDEARPRCKACQRHDVECIYLNAPPRKPPTNKPAGTAVNDVRSPQHLLELSLMHHWTLYTSLCFSSSPRFWQADVAIAALQHSHVADLLFSLTALHISKSNGQALHATHRKGFYYALEEHQFSDEAAANPRMRYISAVLHMTYAFMSIASNVASNLTLWLMMSQDIMDMVSRSPDFMELDTMFGNHDLSVQESVYAADGGRAYAQMLTFDVETEAMDVEDLEAYQAALVYVNYFHHAVVSGQLKAQVLIHLIISMPSRLPQRFSRLVEARRPRAMVLLAHAMAYLKYTHTEAAWTVGIAESVVEMVGEGIPDKWQIRLTTPRMLLEGDIRGLPRTNLISDEDTTE